MKGAESVNVKDARYRRASRLADAVMEWRSLAERSSYPRSLVEILSLALEREYKLGRKAESKRWSQVTVARRGRWAEGDTE